MDNTEWLLDIRPEWVGVKDPKRFILPLSLNARAHWAKRKRVGDAFKMQAFLLCKAARVPMLGHARIIVQAYAVKPRDRDNLAASLKPILDGIVDAKVLTDDSDAYCDLQFRPTVKVAKKIEEKLIITILPLCPIPKDNQ